MPTNEVHQTPIPGVYIDPSAIAAIDAKMKVLWFHGDKTKFNTSSFKPSNPPNVKSSADLFSGDVPGMFFDKQELKASTCVMWQSKSHGQGMFLVEEMGKDGKCFYESCEQEPKRGGLFRGPMKGPEDIDEEMLVDAEDAVIAGVPKDEISLRVFVHKSRDGILTLNTRNQILQLSTDQSNTSSMGRFHGKESVVQCFCYKKGRSLRFINCGLSTTKVAGRRSKLTQDKKCHVPLPADQWHTGFQHEEYEGQEQSIYGTYSQDAAEHNAAVFPRFMDELAKIFGENVGLCKDGDKPGVQIKDG